MPRPRIAITCEMGLRGGRAFLELPDSYAEAVTTAGGLPLLLPNAATPSAARRALAGADGVLFSGGNDIDPRRYGQRRHPKTILLHPEKEASDFRHLSVALARRLPILCVCHGCQLLSVARGGSLIQDLPTQLRGALPHRPPRPGARAIHPVHVQDGSLLRRIVRRPELLTNSSHHQAIDRIGRGLRAVAWSPDGVIEAVEDPARPFVLGVQWHPERMQDRVPHRRLFRALVRAAGRRRGRSAGRRSRWGK